MDDTPNVRDALSKKKDAKGGWTPGIRYMGREIIFEQS